MKAQLWNRWNHIGECFDFDRPTTFGELLHFKLIELFVGYHLIVWAWQWRARMQHFVSVLVPLDIARYIDMRFMFSGGALVTALIITGSVLLAFFRIAPKWTWLSALLAMHVHHAARFCLGQLDHGSNFVGMTLLAFVLAGFFSADPKARRRFALGAMFFFLGWAYVSAGVCKLVAGGSHWVDGSHLVMWIHERTVDVYSNFGSPDWNFVQRAIVEQPWLGSLALSFGLLAELSGFLLWFPRTRPWIALGCFAMHLGIWICMRILFDMYMAQLILVGLPWDRWIDATMARFRRGTAPELPELLTKLA